MTELNKLPAYMQILANRQYQSQRLSLVLDDDRIVKLRSVFAKDKILDDLLHEIAKNAHVLQIGLTFGDEVERVYSKVCKQGKLNIFDVSETQIKRAKEKYAHHNIEITNYNAALFWDEKYDVIICYNLLHELPLKTRQQVMDNVLSALATGGKAVFIDYSRPEWWHPLKWPLFLFNRLYQPFAESLWNAPIETFCQNKDGYRWQHSFYCGHMFQKTVATRKILSNEDVRKLTKLFNRK